MDGDLKVVAAGHQGAVLDTETAAGGGGPHMEAHGGVHIAEVALIPVVVAADKDLLAGLEEQLDSAVQLLTALPQHLGGAQKHGGVTVVTAGVHHAGVLALKVHTAVFLNGEGVDVRPEHNGFARFAALDGGDAAGVVLKGLNGNAQFPELSGKIGSGLMLLERELGMLVQPVPVADDGFTELRRTLGEVHKQKLLSNSKMT